jgi:AraC-like DNA-binding protein
MSEKPDFYHYLPVNDDAMRWGMYITGVGRWRTLAKRVNAPAGHPLMYQFDWKRGRILPEFSINLVTDGRGEFESQATGRVPVKPNSLFFLFPGVWHTYSSDPATGWTERWISFNGETIHRLMNQGLIHPKNAVRPVLDIVGLSNSFDAMLDRIHANPMENSILLSLRMMNFVAEAVEQTRDGPLPSAAEAPRSYKDVNDRLVAEAVDIIWTLSDRPLSVEEIVRKLPTTRRTLERRFAAERGHSILEEINICRLDRACRLLRETDLPVKSIAYLAGFTNRERIRKVFQNAEGCSPSQYRKKYRIPNG